jgi:DNA-binding LacI/PurR family transcriptional regulator/ribosomal protein S25
MSCESKGDVKDQEMSISAVADKAGPLHARITDHIWQAIKNGEYKLGDKLPSQSELVRRYGVSVATVRQSLATLEKRGVIRFEHGRGSFVSLKNSRAKSSVGKFKSMGLLFEKTGKADDVPSEHEILLAFTDVCRSRNIRLLTAETDFGAHAGGQSLLDVFRGFELDGVCAFLCEPHDASQRLEVLAREFPCSVVFIPGPVMHAMPMDCIDVNIEVGMEQLLHYVMMLGHERIAYIGPHIDRCLSGDKFVTGGRWQTYARVLTKSGKLLNMNHVQEISYGEELDVSDRRHFLDMVTMKEGPTAIFAANDWLARQVMQWLWEEKIDVPGFVSVLGFDDISYAKQLVPSLSTVAFPYKKVAENAINLISRRMQNHLGSLNKITLGTEFQARLSIGPVR